MKCGQRQGIGKPTLACEGVHVDVAGLGDVVHAGDMRGHQNPGAGQHAPHQIADLSGTSERDARYSLDPAATSRCRPDVCHIPCGAVHDGSVHETARVARQQVLGNQCAVESVCR